MARRGDLLLLFVVSKKVPGRPTGIRVRVVNYGRGSLLNAEAGVPGSTFLFRVWNREFPLLEALCDEKCHKVVPGYSKFPVSVERRNKSVRLSDLNKFVVFLR